MLGFKLLDRSTFENDLTFNSKKTAPKRIFTDFSNQFKNLIIKQAESVFVVNQNTKLRRKVNPKDKKGKLQDVSFVTQKCIGQKHPLITVAKSLSEIEDETVCDEEFNIILMAH